MGYPIYLVNLDTSTERRARMERLLGGLGMPFELVSAVRGKDLTEAELREFTFHDEMDLGPGEYGCLLSHVAVWERFLATGEDCCFVLEDDLHFAQALDPAWLAALPADKPWALKLETFFNPITIGRKPVARFGNRRIHELLSDHAGTGSYAISRAGARTYLDRYRNMRKAIDTEMFSADRRTIDLDGLTIYQMVPAPCVQDLQLPRKRRELPEATTIGNDRVDAREFKAVNWQQKLLSKLQKQLRKKLGPIYRRVYSLALWPRGRARVQVGFR